MKLYKKFIIIQLTKFKHRFTLKKCPLCPSSNIPIASDKTDSRNDNFIQKKEKKAC